MTTSDEQGGNGNGGSGKGAPQQTPPSGAPEAPALAIIEAFGGIRPMAKTLGLAVSTVQGWKERGAIPTNRHDQIRAAARSHNIAVDAEMLRSSAGESVGPQPQTIEGETTPVVEGRTATVSGAAAPDKPRERVAERPPEPGDQTGDRHAGAPRSSAATAAGAGPRKPGPADASPPTRRRGAFMPGLVAGVVLAAAVAAATIYTRPYWGPFLDPAVQGQGGGAALADLEARLDEMGATLAAADDAPAISAMSERLATLEAALSKGAGQDPGTGAALESLSAELARMSDRMAALEEDFAGVRSAAGAPAAEITSRLSSESQRLDAMLAQQTELAGRIAAAEADLNAAEAAREETSGSRETLLLLATLQLRDALQGSGPYVEPLAVLTNLAEGDAGLRADLGPVLEPLQRRASAGLPSLRDLQAGFPEVARRIAAITAGTEDDGWTAGVLRRLSEAVNLRPVGLVAGAEPTAVAARAEVKLNDGDLAGALAELEALEGAAAEAAASWRADAEARLAAERAVGALGALVSRRFADMTGG